MRWIFGLALSLAATLLALTARREYRRLQRMTRDMKERHVLEDKAFADWKQAVREKLEPKVKP